MTATARPEAQPAVYEHPPTFDEVYAAHYADLTVQLFAYFNDRPAGHAGSDLLRQARSLCSPRRARSRPDPMTSPTPWTAVRSRRPGAGRTSWRPPASGTERSFSELRAPWSWPPQRFQVATGPVEAVAELWIHYESTTGESAQFSWAVIEQ